MTAPPDLVPGPFRWRLILVFLLVTATAGGIVAGGSYYLVQRERYTNFEERTFSTADLAASVAEAVDPGPGFVTEVLKRLDRGRFEAVVVTAGDSGSTDPQLDSSDVPNLEEKSEGFRHAHDELGGQSFFVVSPTRTISDARIYLYFPTEHVEAELSQLRGALVRSLLVVVVLAGLVGHFVARQTLRPVARASRAARMLAEGLLETRLPVERKDEFGAWAASFNEMAQALQDKIAALTEARERERRFTSDVAHELRTPLTALLTSTTMMRKELDAMPPEARWAAERAVGQVARLRDLVDEILEISRLDAGQHVVHLEDVRVDRFLDAIVEDRRWTATVDISSDIGVLSTDPHRLERVLSNLIENALTHGGGRARVAATANGSGVSIEVSDKGPGIEEIHLPHIFDRFYKGDESRGGGTGLGLAIARENARLLGGEIHVASAKDSGTRFTVKLPRWESTWITTDGIDVGSSISPS